MLEKCYCIYILYFYCLPEVPFISHAGEKIESSTDLWSNSEKTSPVICIGYFIICPNIFWEVNLS